MIKAGQTYMNLVNGIERKKCGYLDNHVCPLAPSKARKGESCDGCPLLDKLLFLKDMSMKIEEYEKVGGIK